MTRGRTQWRGVLASLALLVAFPVLADAPLKQAVRAELRNENYVLVEDRDSVRLFVLSSGSVTAVTTGQRPEDLTQILDDALKMTRNVDSRIRVRGLTLLSGVDDPAALDAALVLLSDPAAAVREEAVQLIIEHPGADIDGVVDIALRDPSPRVRETGAALIEERSDDRRR